MEVKKTPGRTGIDKSVYTAQIQTWLNGDYRMSDITATMLQKAVGGQYKKSVDCLEEFKQGYETKELADLPQPPEAFTNLLNSAGLDAWRVLWEEKNKSVADATAAFEIERKELITRADEYLNVIDQHEQEIEELKAQLETNEQITHSVTQEKLALNDDLTKERIKLAQTSERAEQFEQRLTESSHQLTSVTNKNAQLEKDQEQSKQTINTLTKQLAELTTKSNTLSDQVTGLTEKLTAEQSDTKRLSSVLEQERSANVKLTADIATKIALHDQLTTQLEQCQEQSKILAIQSTKSLEDANKRLDKLQGELVKIAGKAK